MACSQKFNDKDFHDPVERYRARTLNSPPNVQLSPRDVREIRARSADGETPTRLAKEFGVVRGTILNILAGIRHKDVI